MSGYCCHHRRYYYCCNERVLRTTLSRFGSLMRAKRNLDHTYLRSFRQENQRYSFECVDAFSEAPITQENQRRCSLHRGGRSARGGRTVRGLVRGGGAFWSGADGPRHRAGRSATWCRSPSSLPDGRTVRACAGAAEDRRRRLDLAPGRDPVGEERS
jgi:hypothetical protein